jgi:methylenetetrahydrofolate--tRNA-(uracil-5-)-methyltransferase
VIANVVLRKNLNNWWKKKMVDYITVIGGGLAGCEAAWQIAQRGIKVKLYEMKPEKYSPAHSSTGLAEIVCSNSFKSISTENASGLLKQELRIMDSLIMECADENRVPAGQALAVDRENFSKSVTNKIESHLNIELIRKEINEIPSNGTVIIATGPLTSETLSKSIQTFLGKNYLYFFDAAAPIVTKESLNINKIFKADRYGKGDSDYINCPMTEGEYNAFYDALISAEIAELHDFEDDMVFEGCMPIEVMAKRGRKTLAFGPLKPVGFVDPATGKRPYAVVQLRQDNAEGTLFNLVGFQTNLKWGEQKKVFKMIPGLENAEFVRHGVMHRNTYLNSPALLTPYYNLKSEPRIFFAGQVTGVEGYVESVSSGLVSGINASRYQTNKELVEFPRETVAGALASYVSTQAVSSFQPMNANFGILPKPDIKINKDMRKKVISELSMETLRNFKQEKNELLH